MPFHFCDVTRIVYLADKFAYDLESFRHVFTSISNDSLYYHFIESRIKNDTCTDDFSTWIKRELGLTDLGQQIEELDIYVYDLTELRQKICEVIDEHLRKTGQL